MFDFLKRLLGRPPSPLAPPLQAAQRMYGVSQKDAALRELVRDAAAAGDVGMVRQALDAMYDVSARSTAGYDAAIQLARAGDAAGAIATAQRIYETELRDEALAKIAEGSNAV